ncbi:MAG: thiamine pyrophosphate-dependent dehydrogenase E1 component subunit alpha [Armatimonadetes bacterium]|nr:thiamine pyrophosphate-dependent dehydrogenase E1 component subunit alpha [Armatimonadota bacterium]
MLQVNVNQEIVLSPEKAIEMYRRMMTIRRFEQRSIELYREGSIRGYFHPYLGEEAIAVGVCEALRNDDAIVSTHRGHGHCIAKGMDLGRMMAELLGREGGYCRGRGGSMHIADVSGGVLGANGIVGGGIPIAIGVAKGFRLFGTDRIAVCFFSDGASNNGVFAESINMAAIWNLPVLFVLENNHYAVSTRIDETSMSAALADRATAYGIQAETINGNEVDLVYETATRGAGLCRKGGGPFLMECKTYRHGGHHVNDPGSYMPKDEMDFWRGKNDPIDRWRSRLISSGLAEGEDLNRIDGEVESLLDEAVEFAKRSPEPSVEEFLAELEASRCHE